MFKYGKAICYQGYRDGQSPILGVYPTKDQILEDLLILDMEFDYMISKYFHPTKESNEWVWWDEINKLPDEFIQYAAGCALFGFVGINKNVLSKILNSKYDSIFNLDIFFVLYTCVIVLSLCHQTIGSEE